MRCSSDRRKHMPQSGQTITSHMGHALLIGIAAYRHMRLLNKATIDARDLYAMLLRSEEAYAAVWTDHHISYGSRAADRHRRLPPHAAVEQGNYRRTGSLCDAPPIGGSICRSLDRPSHLIWVTRC